MKKNYIAPESKTMVMSMVSIVCQSGVFSEQGIGYGGVDEEGEMEPAARRRCNVWNDEEEEDEW